MYSLKLGYLKSQLVTKIHYTSSSAQTQLSHSIRKNLDDSTMIICIGTDRCIGDSLGPLVGTLLKERNCRFPVFGTLDNPIHAVNLKKHMTYINEHYPSYKQLAVDACLGKVELIGNIHVKQGPIFPGKGVGKKLPSVGHSSIIGIVDKYHNDDCFSIHTVRLSLVRNMAMTIVDAILEASLLN